MDTPAPRATGLLPRPDAGMLTGALAATAGYLLPWFRQSDSYSWWYSGWEYATLSTSGGWTLITLGWLLAAVLASLWAGRAATAALWGVVAAVGALLFSSAVVAASFATIPERSSINHVTALPVGIGLPLLAGGLGLLLAAAVRAIAVRPR